MGWGWRRGSGIYMVTTLSSALNSKVQARGFHPIPCPFLPVSPAQTPPGFPIPTSVKVTAKAHTIPFQLRVFGCSLPQSCWLCMVPAQGPNLCCSLPRTFSLRQTLGRTFTSFKSPLSNVILSVTLPNYLYETATPDSHLSPVFSVFLSSHI